LSPSKYSGKKRSFTAALYTLAYPEIKTWARKLGYAIAIHGSMIRDFDVIAIPWSEDAVDAETFINSLSKLLSIYADSDEIIHGPERKPHGRLAWTIPMGTGMVLDVSVMPRESNSKDRS